MHYQLFVCLFVVENKMIFPVLSLKRDGALDQRFKFLGKTLDSLLLTAPLSL